MMETARQKTLDYFQELQDAVSEVTDRLYMMGCVVPETPTPFSMWCPHCYVSVEATSGPFCPQCKSPEIYSPITVIAGILYNEVPDEKHFPETGDNV